MRPRYPRNWHAALACFLYSFLDPLWGQMENGQQTYVPGVYASQSQNGTDVTPIELRQGAKRMLNSLESALRQQLDASAIRFADHETAFRVETRRFTFNHLSGPKDQVLTVVWDGPRFVAIIEGGFAQLVATDPVSAPREVALTTGRFHIDRHVGALCDVDLYMLPERYRGEAHPKSQWESAPGQLILHRFQESAQRTVDNILVFSVDPIFGYRIDGTYRIDVKQALREKKEAEVWSYFTAPGVYVPWPEAYRYDYGILTLQDATAGTYHGWVANQYSIDRSDGIKNHHLSDPGMIAFLSRDPQRFSPALFRDNAMPPRDFVQCNAGHGIYLNFSLGLDAPDAAMPRRLESRRTLLHLPPELREALLQQTEFLGSLGEGVCIRMGRTESFEDQPIPISQPTRGLIWTSHAPPVIEETARTGKRSLLFVGDSWPNLPQIGLEPKTTYLLEAWFKIIPWSEAERQSEIESGIRKLMKSQKKDADAITQAERKMIVESTATKAEAWIDADYYEWSPHSKQWIVRHETNRVSGDTDEWQRVHVELETPEWDPFVNIVFRVRGGTAYMDDFRLIPLKEVVR